MFVTPFFEIMESVFTALQQGIAPAIVVVVYLIIIRIIDNKREAKQATLNADLIKSITSISNFLKKITDNILIKDKDKSKIAIEDAFIASAMRINKFFVQTVINNNIIKNKDNILANIHNLVKSEYYTTYSILSLYSINENRLSDYLKSSWMTEVENDIKDNIFNSTLNKEHKILSFQNKLEMRFKSYITYVTNNGLK